MDLLSQRKKAALGNIKADTTYYEDTLRSASSTSNNMTGTSSSCQTYRSFLRILHLPTDRLNVTSPEHNADKKPNAIDQQTT